MATTGRPPLKLSLLNTSISNANQSSSLDTSLLYQKLHALSTEAGPANAGTTLADAVYRTSRPGSRKGSVTQPPAFLAAYAAPAQPLPQQSTASGPSTPSRASEAQPPGHILTPQQPMWTPIAAESAHPAIAFATPVVMTGLHGAAVAPTPALPSSPPLRMGLPSSPLPLLHQKRGAEDAAAAPLPQELGLEDDAAEQPSPPRGPTEGAPRPATPAAADTPTAAAAATPMKTDTEDGVEQSAADNVLQQLAAEPPASPCLNGATTGAVRTITIVDTAQVSGFGGGHTVYTMIVSIEGGADVPCTKRYREFLAFHEQCVGIARESAASSPHSAWHGKLLKRAVFPPKVLIAPRRKRVVQTRKEQLGAYLGVVVDCASECAALNAALRGFCVV